MMLQSESGIMAEADARVFQMLMSANRTTRRLMAADRTVAAAYRRVATLRRMQAAQASREHAKAEAELEKELGGSGIEPGWGRIFIVKVKPEPTQTRSSRVRSAARGSTSRRAIRAYAGPLLDKRGRQSVYIDIKYRGLKSKGWRPGLSADHIEYIMRELALEMAANQLDKPITNMGETVEEIMVCWRALEQIEQGYRANATVQYRIVWNLPAELNAEQRRDLVTDFCERVFGRLGLPYAAAIHTPDPEGDRRNFHAHITFSTRPCQRIGDHEWAISEEKVNGLTDKPGLRLIRALGAAHMNRACRKAGVQKLYTHQTYAQRGLNAERQAHVGGAGMAAHARGEYVGAVARNAALVEQNEIALALQQVEAQLDATQHLQQLLVQAERASIRRSGVIAAIDAARRLQRIVAETIVKTSPRRPIRSTTTSRALVSDLHARARALGSRGSARQYRHQVVAPGAALVGTTRQMIERLTKIERRSHAATSSTMAAAARVVAHCRSVCAKLAFTRQAQPSASARAQTITAFSAIFNRKITALDQARDTNARGRVALATVERQIIAHGEAERKVRIAQIRAAVMTNPALVCTLVDNQISADLAALAEEDQRAFLSLDAKLQSQLLLDRYEADKQALARDGARKRVEAAAIQREHDQAAQRSAAIADACRILRESKARPYRRDGKTIYADWTMLTPSERDIVTAVGVGDTRVQIALRDRVIADARADILAPGATPASPQTASSAETRQSVAPAVADADTNKRPTMPAAPQDDPGARSTNRLIASGAEWLSQHRAAVHPATRASAEPTEAQVGMPQVIGAAPAGNAQPHTEPSAAIGTVKPTDGRGNEVRQVKPRPKVSRADILIAASSQRDDLRAGWRRGSEQDEVGEGDPKSQDKPVDIDVAATRQRDAIKQAIQQSLGPGR